MRRLWIGLGLSAFMHVCILWGHLEQPRAMPTVSVNPGTVSVRMVEKKTQKSKKDTKQRPSEPKKRPTPTEKPETEPRKKPKPEPEKQKKETKPKDKKNKKQSTRKSRGAKQEWVKKTDYKNNPSPSYPYRARRNGWEGTVVLKVRVNKAGRVEQISVKESSGYPLLDQAALKTVRRWEFTPARYAGTNVSSTVLVPIYYQLN